MSKRLQAGSAHLVIIVILVVALAATLGFIFYQNVINRSNGAYQSSDTTSVQTEPTVTSEVAFASSIYEIDHPANWAATASVIQGDYANGGRIDVVNKDGTVRVRFEVSDKTRIGICNSADGLSLSYYNLHATAVKNLTSTTLHVVEAMIDATGGGYNYKIGLTPDGGDTHTAVGASSCTVQHIGEVSDIMLDKNHKPVQPTITATIDFPLLLAKGETKVKGMQPVKDLIATTDYATAVKIIESARKK